MNSAQTIAAPSQHVEITCDDAPRNLAGDRPVVVVVGPLGSTGGMATAMRLQLQTQLANGFELVAFDNGKRTPPTRPWYRGLQSQAGILRDYHRVLRRHRPQIVHLHTCSGLSFHRSMADAALARWCGARVVLHVHGGRFGAFLSRLRWPARTLVRRTLVKADSVIVLGRRWARILQRFDERIRLSIVRNGVPLPEDAAARPAVARPTIVCVSNLSRNKGVDTLIEAVATLPAGLRRDLDVRILGHDPENRLAELQSLVGALGLDGTVRLLGECAPDDVQHELRRAWIFALPSRVEALPMALLEAMAAGLPCVATRVGAVPELLRHRREGLLVGPGDPTQLCAALRRLLAEEGLRQRLGLAARQRVRDEFTPQRVGQGLADVYRRILDAAGPA